MRFRINYEINGYSDSVILEGDSIDEIREKADKFTSERNIDISTCWSEKLD